MNFYYYSICHVCKKPSPDLKKCNKCKVLHYCSREHQVQDWPNHKKICKIITQISKFLVFPAGSSASEFNRFKFLRALLWHFELERPLEMYEHEMWMYPKVCTACYSSEVTIICQVCLSVAYCSPLHQQLHKSEHDQFCPQLKLCLEMQQNFREDDSLDWMNFSFAKEAQVLPENIKEVVKLMKFKDGKNHNLIMLSDYFCPAINVLYALEKSQFVEKRRSRRNKLVIHVIDPNPELHNKTQWMSITEFLSHWLSNLKVAKIILVSSEFEGDQRLSFNFNCEECTRKHFTGMIVSLEGEYHTFVGKIPRPDLVVMFHSDLNESEDFQQKMKSEMICYHGTPVIMTSFEQQELSREFPASEFKFFVEPQANPYGSLRPVRSFIEGGQPVRYRNNFVTIIAKK